MPLNRLMWPMGFEFDRQRGSSHMREDIVRCWVNKELDGELPTRHCVDTSVICLEHKAVNVRTHPAFKPDGFLNY